MNMARAQELNKYVTITLGDVCVIKYLGFAEGAINIWVDIIAHGVGTDVLF